MTVHTFNVSINVCSLLMWATILLAHTPLQISAEPNNNDLVKKYIRFAVVTHSESYLETFHYRNEDSWNQVTLSAFHITEPVLYQGPRVLNLYSDQAENGGTLQARIDLAAFPNDLILFLIPHKQGNLSNVIYAVPNSTNVFPGQSVMLINLSRSDIIGYFSGETGDVKPGDFSVISFEKSNNPSLRMMVAVRNDASNWDMVYNTAVPSRQKNLRWVLVYTGTPMDAEQSRILTFRDRLPKASTTIRPTAPGKE